MITLLDWFNYYQSGIHYVFSPALLEQDIPKYLRHILAEKLGLRVGLVDSPYNHYLRGQTFIHYALYLIELD